MWILYLYLSSTGFGEVSFLVGAVMFLVASSISGYIVLSDIWEDRQKQIDRLSHIVKETLHELNLPTATIKANVTMLYKTSIDTKMSRRIERIEKSTDRLHRLYQELSYTLKSEVAPVEREEFDISELLADRVELARELGRHHIVLDTTPMQVILDKIGLEQAIDNIIENAMKYSDADSTISIKLHDKIVSIEDSGIGMDETELLRIYERYYQGDESMSGEGIGLALVKRYCDRYGLEISIQSTPHKGTKVMIDLSK